MRSFFGLGVLALAVASAATAGVVAASRSGSQQLVCVNSAPGSCRLPFYALYSRPPESFGDTRVAVKGVLIERGGEYYLYPTSESARHSIIEASLHVLDERDEPPEGLEHLKGEYVQVVGRLRSEPGSNAWGGIVIRARPQALPEYVEGLPPAPPSPFSKPTNGSKEH